MATVRPKEVQPWKQTIKPIVSAETARCLVERLYGLRVQSVNELNSYDDRNWHVHVDAGYCVNNNIADISRHGYVLKILNDTDSLTDHVGKYTTVAPLNVKIPLNVKTPLNVKNNLR